MTTCSFGACQTEATRHMMCVHSSPVRILAEERMCERHADMVTSWGDHHGVYAWRDAQCEAFWPSAVSGGLTDAQCVEPAKVSVDGQWMCEGCAGELAS